MDNNPHAVNVLKVPEAAFLIPGMPGNFDRLNQILQQYTKEVRDTDRSLHIELQVPFAADEEGAVTPREMDELAGIVRHWITSLIMDPLSKGSENLVVAPSIAAHRLARPFSTILQHEKLVFFGVFPKQSVVQIHDTGCFLEFAYTGSALLLGD